MLVCTAYIKHIVFVEELVQAAPKIDAWVFTALKSASDIEDSSIGMAGNEFDKNHLSFYSNDFKDYPDEIDITVIHNAIDEQNQISITNGVYIFLDVFLGELNAATCIDNLRVIGLEEAKKELIPIEKLKNFLIWRQKEFIEKYEGTRYDTENDRYSIFNASLENGQPLVAVINTDLLDWDKKASHPWVLSIEMKYEGAENNGMPIKETVRLMDEIGDKIAENLQDYEGYLNIGRQTGNSQRKIFFACKDFRKPSKILDMFQKRYTRPLS